jgi:isocitrate dehydrogenase
MWNAHNRGEETSMNPLGMVEALIGALEHATEVDKNKMPDEAKEKMRVFIATLRLALHNTFRYGQGTRDMAGEQGLTTEQFVEKVALRLAKYMVSQEEHEQPKTQTPDVRYQKHYNVDKDALSAIFDEYDTDHNGTITLDELEVMLTKLGVAPFKDISKIPSASDIKK